MGLLDPPALSPRAGLAQIARGDSDIAVRALRSDLDCGYSTSFGWHGDSTGDSYGETTDNNPGERTPVKLAKFIGQAFPNYHILARRYTSSESGIKTLQAKSAGREYAAFAGRTVRYQPTVSTDQLSGNAMDLRILIAPDQWVKSAEQTMVCSTHKAVGATGQAQALRFSWNLNPTSVNANPSMLLRWSTNSTSWTNGAYSPAIPSPVNGQPMWLRVYITITPGTSAGIQFYYSLDDTATWQSLGGPINYNATDIGAIAFDPLNFFEIAGSGWQSVAAPMAGKVYEVQIRAGLNGKPITPCLPRLWQRNSGGNVTYGGAPTLYLVNASWSGSSIANHMANIDVMCPDYGQTAAFFNMGHNHVDASGPVQWLTPYQEWVSAVQARLPQAAPVAVLQNPHTAAWANEAAYGVSHQLRIRELSRYAGLKRWGQLDLYRAFVTDPRGVAALLMADGLHPNAAGYDVAAAAGARMLGIAA